MTIFVLPTQPNATRHNLGAFEVGVGGKEHSSEPTILVLSGCGLKF